MPTRADVRVASLRTRIALTLGASLSAVIISTVAAVVLTSAPVAMFVPSFVLIALVLSAILIAGCMWFGFWVADDLMKPIALLTERLEYVTEHGDDLTSAALPPFEEVQRVGVTVNKLIGASRRREDQLATAVGAMAHDVRTNLRSVLTVFRQSRVGDGGDVRMDTSTADVVERELEKTRLLASDLVLMLRAPQRATHRLPVVEVATVVRDVSEAVRSTTTKHIDVFVERDFERKIDVVTLERGLRNLLDNAARVAATQVVITVFEGLIIIADDGPGFPAGREGPAHAPSSGHGYGFDIARSLIARLGGRVTIERSGADGTQVLVYV